MEVRSPLGLHELAAHLGLPVPWLKAEALAGRVPCLRAGRRLLFDRAAVERAIASRAAGELGLADPRNCQRLHLAADLGEVAGGR